MGKEFEKEYTHRTHTHIYVNQAVYCTPEITPL